MADRQFFARSLIGREGETHQAVNPPDRPEIVLKPLSRGSVLASTGTFIPEGTVAEPARLTVHKGYDPETERIRRITTSGLEITPLIPLPLVPHRKIGRGGGRTIGGGTSPEALRRARKKAGQRPH